MEITAEPPTTDEAQRERVAKFAEVLCPEAITSLSMAMRVTSSGNRSQALLSRK